LYEDTAHRPGTVCFGKKKQSWKECRHPVPTEFERLFVNPKKMKKENTGAIWRWRKKQKKRRKTNAKFKTSGPDTAKNGPVKLAQLGKGSGISAIAVQIQPDGRRRPVDKSTSGEKEKKKQANVEEASLVTGKQAPALGLKND